MFSNFEKIIIQDMFSIFCMHFLSLNGSSCIVQTHSSYSVHCWLTRCKGSRLRIPDDCCCISISYEYDGIFPSVYDGDIYTSDTSMHILLTLSYVVKIDI